VLWFNSKFNQKTNKTLHLGTGSSYLLFLIYSAEDSVGHFPALLSPIAFSQAEKAGVGVNCVTTQHACLAGQASSHLATQAVLGMLLLTRTP
jgi:hypothetical protein